MKGYAEVEEVAAYMGIDFNDNQTTLCEILLGAAEQWIDEATGYAWLETAAVTKTFHNMQTPFIKVPAPIASITGITWSTYVGLEVPVALDTHQYRMFDAAKGLIYSPYTAGVYQVSVTYEPVYTVPPDGVHMATIVLAAHGLRLSPSLLDGVDPSLVQRYVVGGELTVEFRKSLNVGGGTVPQQVLDFLDPWLKGYTVV